MRTSAFTLLAGLAVMLAVPAHASDALQRDRQALRAGQLSQRHVVDLHRHAQPEQQSVSGAQLQAQAETLGGVNGPYANPYREYPPSCMADPLPATPTGPVYGGQIDLAAWNVSIQNYVRESVTVSIWRVPCSSSGDAANAITLMRIERSPYYDGATGQSLMFPALSVAQGDVNFDNPNDYDLPRVTEEPNTVITWTPIDSSVVWSTTYVLEAYPVASRPWFDYTQAFDLRLDNFFASGQSQYVIHVPAYNPNEYAHADEPLRINGYLSSAYYDPDHDGEGIFIDIFEDAANGRYRLNLTWFTFGPDGEPFWLQGGAWVQPGQRSVTITNLSYRDQGGFAGDFGADATLHRWGSVTLQWPNCQNLVFSYQADAGLPNDVPRGSGNRTWLRLGNINGLTCE